MTPGDAIAQPALGSRLGPYRVEAPLGAGGMGMVYRAVDTRLGRQVAIKIPKTSFDPRFEREARSIAALNHPNICTVHDVSRNYLVMELVEGPTLAARIAAEPVPFAEAMAIARQIADALDTAHQAGIVHRDLKPGNIKIKPDGSIKILDFGLACVHHASYDGTSEDTTHTITVTGKAPGSARLLTWRPTGARPARRQGCGHLGLRHCPLRNAHRLTPV
jgi:serine/threonine-protein kinase